MKRAITFILLFGAGLALLVWLEGRSDPIETPEKTQAEKEVPKDDEEHAPLGFSIGGDFRANIYDRETDARLLHLHSIDSRTTGDHDELQTVDAQLFGQDASVEAELFAKSATIRRLPKTDSDSALEINEHERLCTLREVELKILAGAPIVPLAIEAPDATIDLLDKKNRRITSEGEVAIDSDRLVGAGSGLLLELDHQVLVLERDGWLQFLDGEGESAKLAGRIASDGELRLAQVGTKEAPLLEIGATEKAELLLSDGQKLSAGDITARGREDDDAGVLMQRVDAEGNVSIRAGRQLFSAQRGYIVFSATGAIERAVLEGLPSFRVTLPKVELTGDSPTVLSGSGEGPLVLRFTDGSMHMTLGGPATVTTPSGTLRAGSSLEALFEEDDVSIFAKGGVALDGAGLNLQTAEITARLEDSNSDSPRVFLTTDVGARLDGKLEDGSGFVVTTPSKLVLESIGETWKLVETHDVVASLEGPDGFTARANRVSDFDPETRRLEAEGSVSFETADGTGTGDRLRVLGPRYHVLSGTESRPAHFEGEKGTLDARSFERVGERLHAKGDVTGTVRPAGPDGPIYDLTCDELDVERTEFTRAEDGKESDRFEVRARGNVSGQWNEKGRVTTLSAQRLDGHTFQERDADGEELQTRSNIELQDQVETTFTLDQGKLDLRAGRAELSHQQTAGGESSQSVQAWDDVDFKIDAIIPAREGAPESRLELEGRGERLVVAPNGDGRLEPEPGGRASVEGKLPATGAPFELTTDLFLFFLEEQRLDALRPSIEFERKGGPDQEPQVVIATADRLVASESALRLIGDVRVTTFTPSGAPVRIKTDEVAFLREGNELQSMQTSGGVLVEIGSDDDLDLENPIAIARGEGLIAESVLGSLRLEGSPACIETPVVRFEAEWIEFDPDLQIVTSTGSGNMTPTSELALDGGPQWRLEFLASQTLIEPDSLIYVLDQPWFQERQKKSELRACWAVFWLDRQEWKDLPTQLARGEVSPDELRLISEEMALPQEVTNSPARLFGLFETTAFAGLLRETYFEGPVEVEQNGEILARADAIFLNVEDGHGWLADATVVTPGSTSGGPNEKIIIRADWLRHSGDRSMRADSATLTPCDYADPHVRIVTEDLRIDPIGELDEKGRPPRYWAELKDSSVDFYGVVTVPLPDYSGPLDEEFKPILSGLRFGNSGRYGSYVSTKIVRPAGEVGRKVNRLFDGDRVDYDADFHLDASWFRSRGILLDLALDVESKGDYWFDLHVGGLPDGGKDRGLIRVPKRNRDNLRLWYRARSRHVIDEDQWIDFGFSHQTDPGVQSEFFESEFQRYEQRETFLQWRLGDGANYYRAGVEVRLDDWRTEIEELPSLRAYQGLDPIGSIAGVPLLHTGEVRAEFLRRLEADPLTGIREIDATLQSPFALPERFPDGEGDREVLRLSVRQRLEAPFDLGWAGLRATPFIGANFTAWDEGIERDRSPARFVADAGLRLSTTLWKRGEGGELYTVSPFVEVRDDFENHAQGGPLRFDEIDDSSAGTYVDFGARSRWGVDESGDAVLDLDLRLRNAQGVESRGGIVRSPDRDNGWSTAILGFLDIEPFGFPVEIFHDGRYAFDDEDDLDTVYALTQAAWRVSDSLRFQGGHRRGRIPAEMYHRDPLFPFTNLIQGSFETASISGIFTWTDKWEFEARQVFSLRTSVDLNTDFIVRRFGHDIIFEIESSLREGEGTSLSFSLSPRFGYEPSTLGYLNY